MEGQEANFPGAPDLDLYPDSGGARQQISLLWSFLFAMEQDKADAVMGNRKRVKGDFLRWFELLPETEILK